MVQKLLKGWILPICGVAQGEGSEPEACAAGLFLPLGIDGVTITSFSSIHADLEKTNSMSSTF